MLNLGWTSDEVQAIFMVLTSLHRQFISGKGEKLLFMQWRNWTECWPITGQGQGRPVPSDGTLGGGHNDTYAISHPKMQNPTLIMRKHQTQNEWLCSDKRWEVYRFQKCQCHGRQKKSRWKFFRWKKAKETWKLYAVSDPRLHTVLEGKCYKRQHWVNRLNWSMDDRMDKIYCIQATFTEVGNSLLCREYHYF